MKRAVCVIILALAALTSSPSLAGDEGVDEAKTQFAAGGAHFQAHRWQDALAAFERANAIVPSPNTELLIGRCLRELGQAVEAVKMFDGTVEHAKRRVQAGEAKYQQAGEAAAREGEAIRRTLGTLRIRVGKAGADGIVTRDGKRIEVDAEGSATVLSAPGAATLEFSVQGRVERQTVTLLPGDVVDVEFSAGPAPAPQLARTPPTSDTPSPSHPWVWAALGAGALTAIGGGIYLGFNNAARSTYDDLVARCGPNRCTEQDRPDADRGRQQQTIAMVGLAVGAVAAVAMVAFTVIALGRPQSQVARVRPMSAMLTW